MRSNGATLNAQLSRVVSELGHTDTIVVTDAGLPIPVGVERVDLAIREGLPAFLDLLDTVLAEVKIEDAVAPAEIDEHSPEMAGQLRARLAAHGVMLKLIPHVDFKHTTQSCRAAIRSGEFTPYANVILKCGVVY